MKSGKNRAYTFREIRESFFFIFPLLVFMSLFIILPVTGTFIKSLFRDVTFLETKFIFLKNYFLLMRDAGFWQSARFTLLFILVTVPLEIMLGMAFALLLNIDHPLKGLLRASILIPWAMPAAVSARIWELIYHYHYGLANYLGISTGVLSSPVNWLGSSWGAFFSVIIADVWKTTPFIAIILLAGLQAIPGEIHRQARIDRANFLQIFTHVTLPLMRPVIIVALLFRTIDAIRVFDLIYVLTGGGPGGSTTSLSLFAHRYFLSGDFGYGSAVSVILFFGALFFSIFYVRAGKFRRQMV